MRRLQGSVLSNVRSSAELLDPGRNASPDCCQVWASLLGSSEVPDLIGGPRRVASMARANGLVRRSMTGHRSMRFCLASHLS